jgi:thiosulfate/3-mercaptopyruvate sulfurtransferase
MGHNSISYKIKASVPVFLLLLLIASKSASAFDLALIEPAVLIQDRGQWIILDARPESDWLAGHIPGALSFSWENYTRTDENGRAYRLARSEQLAVALGQMGMVENTPVVVYGDADRSMGGEGWITLGAPLARPSGSHTSCGWRHPIVERPRLSGCGRP